MEKCKKEKYNIAQNQSFAQKEVGQNICIHSKEPISRYF